MNAVGSRSCKISKIATALPIPELAPVTSAVCPSRCRLGGTVGITACG